MTIYPIKNTDVMAVFSTYPTPIKMRLFELRELIFDVGAKIDGVGEIDECLKWGQPSYLTNETKSGTTIRIDASNKNGGDFAIYVNCKTSLIDDFKQQYPELKYGGNRSVHFSFKKDLPKEELSHLIAMALTYHKK